MSSSFLYTHVQFLLSPILQSANKGLSRSDFVAPWLVFMQIFFAPKEKGSVFSQHDGNNMPPLRSVDKHAKSSLQCSVYFELSNAFANKKTTDGAYMGCAVLSKNGFESCWKVGTKLSHWNTSGPSSRCEKLLPVLIFMRMRTFS